MEKYVSTVSVNCTLPTPTVKRVVVTVTVPVSVLNHRKLPGTNEAQNIQTTVARPELLLQLPQSLRSNSWVQKTELVPAKSQHFLLHKG